MGQRSPDFVTQKVVMMKPQVADWFERRTSSSAQWPLGHLMSIKGDTTVSVVLPALNEAATVANIVTTIRDHLGDGAAPGDRIVDELIVLDSGSTDSTAALACGAGAKVVHRDEVLPRIPTVPGKGEAMWRSLAATTGDIVVFIDADLRSFTPHTALACAPGA